MSRTEIWTAVFVPPLVAFLAWILLAENRSRAEARQWLDTMIERQMIHDYDCRTRVGIVDASLWRVLDNDGQELMAKAFQDACNAQTFTIQMR